MTITATHCYPPSNIAPDTENQTSDRGGVVTAPNRCKSALLFILT